MKTQKKVYCEKCKYHLLTCEGYKEWIKKYLKIHDIKPGEIIPVNPNENNHCPHYRPKWYIRLFNLFK